MSLLVDDLLLLARLDEGRPLEREPVDLDAVVSRGRRHGARGRAGLADRARGAGRRSSLGDRDRLRQLVDNLLANVRAHTPAGTPVDVRARDGGGSRRARRSQTPARG